MQPSASHLAVEADIAVKSGRAATTGYIAELACLVDDNHGYPFSISTENGGREIGRIQGDELRGIAGEQRSAAVSSPTENVRLRAECSSTNGVDRTRLLLNGHLLGSGVDDDGLGSFRGVGLHEQRFPGVVCVPTPPKAEEIGYTRFGDGVAHGHGCDRPHHARSVLHPAAVPRKVRNVCRGCPAISSRTGSGVTRVEAKLDIL